MQNNLNAINAYPLVLFEYGLNSNKLNDIVLQVKGLINDLKKDNNLLASFVANINISKQKRKELIVDLYQNKIDQYLLDFLRAIIDFNRGRQLLRIFKQFLYMCNDYLGISIFKIHSPYQLTKNQIDQLYHALSQKYGNKIQLVNVVDQSLIGGIKLTSNTISIDGSFTNQLSEIKKAVVLALSQNVK